MRNDKNNFDQIGNFVLEILKNSYKLPKEISISEKNNSFLKVNQFII